MKVVGFISSIAVIVLTSFAFYYLGVPAGIVVLLATLFIALVMIETAVQFDWDSSFKSVALYLLKSSKRN